MSGNKKDYGDYALIFLIILLILAFSPIWLSCTIWGCG